MTSFQQADPAKSLWMRQRTEQTAYAVRMDQLVRCWIFGYLRAAVLDGYLERF